ncbi:SGNH/GDSL hydrolase family protein [Lacticigenium naphthae]|uniref:SGNH/GDSL hydrolase family protein n=1 Tax=Lacticigenium naphthae TaxID=515351 RepID=UPI0003F5029E|nr:SGNH/GDSL hydrolase family protein [Lacticigenium naphthae]
MKLKRNDRILFIGDSVTEAGRNISDDLDLGKGYPLLVGSELFRKYPDYHFSFINRGVGGNKIRDLVDRWEVDCLNLKPDIVSILIGINDTWHNIDSDIFGTEAEFENFESDYRFLLKQVLQRTDARVILIDPFVLAYPKDRSSWRKDLDPRIQIVRKMAREYQTDYIPLDALLNKTGLSYGFKFLTGEDGVHPTLAGHSFIAQEWLNNCNLN